MNIPDNIMALAERLDPDRPTILRIDAEHAGVELRRLHAENEALVRDAERLDWMIFHSAKVRHSSDGEFCTVTWYDDEGQAHVTKLFGNARQAIDAAMQEKQS